MSQTEKKQHTKEKHRSCEETAKSEQLRQTAATIKERCNCVCKKKRNDTKKAKLIPKKLKRMDSSAKKELLERGKSFGKT